jgi:8-oxo-dGTP pyrophosphatase MutT (NUDIX family)
MRRSYGGVVIDRFARVLLREPAWHDKGQAWTFAKGGAKGGESPGQAALREVFEETGVRAEITAKIPGSFDGGETANEFFLMRPLEDTGKFDWETWRVRWASQEEAAALLSLTLKEKRRERDLHLLATAFTLYYTLEKPAG